MANGPTTAEAEEILSSDGVHIIPDILCNGGGVIVSYFEMVQNQSSIQWEEEEILEPAGEKDERGISFCI